MECPHPMLYKNMCAACGAKIKRNNDDEVEYSSNFAASGGREVKITNEEADRIEQANISALHSMKKLSLVLDLDNTLLNATASTTYTDEKMKDSRELIISDHGRSHRYFVKLRPKLQYFLDELSPLYQMSIYTHGTRKYAEGTCKIMDPDGVYFGKRIVSRCDHPELRGSKSLAHLLKTDWSMVLIYDDREDVWKGEQGEHLLCAKPFVHFDQQGKGAVLNNAPGILSLGAKPAAGDEEDKVSEDTEEEEDENEGLVQVVSTFKKLHQLYFNNSATNGNKVSIGHILKGVRLQILAGCVLCFSGVIPVNYRNPEQHSLWKTARRLGAEVERGVTEQTTHLLAVGVGASKARECLQRSDVFVLHCDWLLHCHWNVEREQESSYFLSPEHKPTLAKSKVAERAAALKETRLLVRPQEEDEEGNSHRTLKKARLEEHNSSSSDGDGSDSHDKLSGSEEGSECGSSAGSSSGDDEWLQELENDVAFADDNDSDSNGSDSNDDNYINDDQNINNDDAEDEDQEVV